MDVTIRVPPGADRVTFLGAGDRNLKMIREALGVNVASRDDEVRLSGEPLAVAAARLALERIGDRSRDRAEPAQDTDTQPHEHAHAATRTRFVPSATARNPTSTLTSTYASANP